MALIATVGALKQSMCLISSRPAVVENSDMSAVDQEHDLRGLDHDLRARESWFCNDRSWEPCRSWLPPEVAEYSLSAGAMDISKGCIYSMPLVI